MRHVLLLENYHSSSGNIVRNELGWYFLIRVPMHDTVGTSSRSLDGPWNTTRVGWNSTGLTPGNPSVVVLPNGTFVFGTACSTQVRRFIAAVMHSTPYISILTDLKSENPPTHLRAGKQTHLSVTGNRAFTSVALAAQTPARTAACCRRPGRSDHSRH